MKKTLPRLSALLLGALVLSPGATAQLWGNPRATAASPVFSDFKVSGDQLSRADAKIELDRVGQRVVGIYVEAPQADTDAVARALLAGWGAPEEAVADLKGVLDDPGFQEVAARELYQEPDGSGQGEVSLRLKNGRWMGYNALRVRPPSDFPKDGSGPLGSEAAPSRIDIVSDYECPFCKQLWDSPAMAYWRGRPNIFQLHYHHFPLPMHPNALAASTYGICAEEAGKGWEFSDLVYQKYEEWANRPAEEAQAQLGKYLSEVGGPAKGDECAKAKEKDVLAQSEEVQRKFMIRGTPSVFVNGVLVVNYTNPEEVRRIRAITEGKVSAGDITHKRLEQMR